VPICECTNIFLLFNSTRLVVVIYRLICELGSSGNIVQDIVNRLETSCEESEPSLQLKEIQLRCRGEAGSKEAVC
jgi:hypothetical protein